MRERSREGRTGSTWEVERKEFFERRGWDVREVERRREEGEIWFGELLRKDREMQREERKRKIRDSIYNSWYEVIRIEAISEYLKRGGGKAGGGE